MTRFLLIMLLPVPGTVLAQDFKPGEFEGAWSGVARIESRTYDEAVEPTYRVRHCSGEYELAPYDDDLLRRSIPTFSAEAYPIARKGKRARVVTGVESCADSVLSQDGVTGSATLSTDSIVGVLAYEKPPSHLQASESARSVVFMLQTGDSGAIAVRRFARGSDDALVGEEECPSQGGFVSINRGFGPRQQCSAWYSMTSSVSGTGAQVSLREALQAADSVTGLEMAFAASQDTMLWAIGAPQATTIRAYLAIAPFPQSYGILQVLDLLGAEARFTEGDLRMRQMLAGGYSLSPAGWAEMARSAGERRAAIRAALAQAGTGTDR